MYNYGLMKNLQREDDFFQNVNFVSSYYKKITGHNNNLKHKLKFFTDCFPSETLFPYNLLNF